MHSAQTSEFAGIRSLTKKRLRLVQEAMRVGQEYAGIPSLTKKRLRHGASLVDVVLDVDGGNPFAGEQAIETL